MRRKKRIKVKTQNAYCDRKSLEESTGKTKTKYKLAGNVIADVYTFFIITSSSTSYKARLSIKVEPRDWENRKGRHLNKPYSHISLNNIESLNKSEVTYKRSDSQNTFQFVARLSDGKYLELQKLKNKVPRGYEYADRKANVVDLAIGEANVANNALKKLGLS